MSIYTPQKKNGFWERDTKNNPRAQMLVVISWYCCMYVAVFERYSVKPGWRRPFSQKKKKKCAKKWCISISKSASTPLTTCFPLLQYTRYDIYYWWRWKFSVVLMFFPVCLFFFGSHPIYYLSPSLISLPLTVVVTPIRDHICVCGGIWRWHSLSQQSPGSLFLGCVMLCFFTVVLIVQP